MEHKELKLGERFGQCMYNNGLYEFFGPKVDVTKLELSESVSDLFDAIVVATKMIGSSIQSRFYFSKDYKDDTHLLTVTLNGAAFKCTTGTPVFIWSIKKNDLVKVLILKCDEKLALKYPFNLERINLSLPNNLQDMAGTTINNEQELLVELEEILHNL